MELLPYYLYEIENLPLSQIPKGPFFLDLEHSELPGFMLMTSAEITISTSETFKIKFIYEYDVLENIKDFIETGFTAYLTYTKTVEALIDTLANRGFPPPKLIRPDKFQFELELPLKYLKELTDYLENFHWEWDRNSDAPYSKVTDALQVTWR